MRILHGVSVQDQLISADGIQNFDLAVNPLSVILLCLRPLNDTGTLSEFATYLAACGAVNRATVMYNGVNVISASGRDLAAMAYFRHGVICPQNNHDDINNDRRCVVLPMMMGRFAYDPFCCFPATKRGELVLECDFDIADTGYDGLRLSVETIELVGATPKEYEKKITISQTFGAVGDNDVDIPVGNQIRGMLLFGTTAFAGATPAPSWGRVSTLLDNEQIGYAATDFEVAHCLGSLMGRQPPSMDHHTHRVDATACSATEETAGGPIEVGSDGWQNYAWLDLDPTRDDTFSVDTFGRSRFHLRANAESANAVRCIPVERVKL